MSWIVALGFGCPLCFGQVTIKIRLINVDNRHPISKQPIIVSLLYEKNEKTPPKYDSTLYLETDVNGEAHLGLPEPAPAHLSAHVHLTSRNWHCACMALLATEDLIQKGIAVPQLGPNAKNSDKPIRTEPNEILFLARPYTFLEKLIAPLLKG
jgi:hypothetical protein